MKGTPNIKGESSVMLIVEAFIGNEFYVSYKHIVCLKNILLLGTKRGAICALRQQITF